jgi:hypothetical protein
MRRTLFLALTLLLTLGAVVTSVPRAEAAVCSWKCVCSTPTCVCTGGSGFCAWPRPECPQVSTC